jgi:hypothetical protein
MRRFKVGHWYNSRTVRTTSPHLRALEEIERESIPGLVEMLREEGLEVVRYILRRATDWY